MKPARHVVVADPQAGPRERIAGIVRGLASAGADEDGPLNVHHATNGTEALLLIDRHRPVLVITEVVLAELNGLALLRRVRANAEQEGVPAPPFIFVTTLVRETDRYWGLRNGAHAYVMKPFDDRLLRDRIRDVVVAGHRAEPDKLGLSM